KLWVPLEDIHDGWEKSGSVGQEVYGAGLGFGIVPRHYIKVKNEDFMIYLDYPYSKPVFRKNSISFKVFGDQQMNCRLMVIRKADKSLPAKLEITGSRQKSPGASTVKEGHLEYQLRGDQKIRITW